MAMSFAEFWGRFCDGCLAFGEFLKVSLGGLSYIGLVFVLPIVVFIVVAFVLAAVSHRWCEENERRESFRLKIGITFIGLAQLLLIVVSAIFGYAVTGDGRFTLGTIVVAIIAQGMIIYDVERLFQH